MKRSRESQEDSDYDYTAKSETVHTDLRHLGGEPAAKLPSLDPSEKSGPSNVDMRCSLPGHAGTVSFTTYDEFQSHYHKAHTNRCLECRHNFPSAYMLNLHIEECHDSFVAVKRDKGEHTYSCFVEGCERKCRTPEKRRLHLIDKHMYPKNYYFAVTRTGIDGRRSLLVEGHRRRRSSSGSFSTTNEPRRTQNQHPWSGTQDSGGDDATPATAVKKRTLDVQDVAERPDAEMEDLTGAMSALKFIPHSVKFGRGGARSGFAKR